MGFLQLHEVCHQVGDVDLPVRAQHVAQLAPRAGALGHELGEDTHGGVLVLQGTAAAPPLLLVFILALPRGPAGSQKKLSGPGNGIGDVPESQARQAGACLRPQGTAPQAGASGPHRSTRSITGSEEGQASLGHSH